MSRRVAGRKVRTRALFRKGRSQVSAAERTCRSERVRGLQRVRRVGGYFCRRRALFAAVARPPPRRVGDTPTRPRCPTHQRQAPRETGGRREPPRTHGLTSGGRLPSTGFDAWANSGCAMPSPCAFPRPAWELAMRHRGAVVLCGHKKVNRRTVVPLNPKCALGFNIRSPARSRRSTRRSPQDERHGSPVRLLNCSIKVAAPRAVPLAQH